MAYATAADITARLRGLVFTVQDEPVVRGTTAHGNDTLQHAIKAITAVNSTAKGAQAPDNPTYVLTIDYLYTAGESQIKWTPTGGIEPVAGATYYVQYTAYAIESAATGITDAIDRADSLINSALIVRYPTLPLATVPGMIKEISRTLAAYYVALDVWGEQAIPDGLAKRAEAASKMLDDVRDGVLALVTDAGAVIAQTIVMGSSMKGYQPTFDMGNVEDQVVDADYLTDLADAKT